MLTEREAQLRALGEQLEHRVAERTMELSKANKALREEIEVRVRAETALRASEERFAKAFGASPGAAAIARQAGARIVEVNPRWETLFGYSRDEAIGRTLDELGLLARADGACIAELIARNGCVAELELNLRHRTGDVFPGVLAAEGVDMGGEPCFIMTIRDITERRRAEQEIALQRQQLAHLARVALLGELSGALAHEFNQPLAAILANAGAAQRLLQRDEVDLSELRAILDDIAADDRRAGAVISRVRGLIRKGGSAPQPVAVDDVVREMVDFAHGDLIQRGVSVRLRLSAALPSVHGDRVQLQQILLNLIVNACDAMADLPPAERTLDITTQALGDAIEIAVRDHGSGIAPDSLEAVFAPFVTSKAHGLGLGLAICRSIVDAHGGRMWATNNDRRGSTFHVWLPSAPPDAPSPACISLQRDPEIIRRPVLGGAPRQGTRAPASRPSGMRRRGNSRPSGDA